MKISLNPQELYIRNLLLSVVSTRKLNVTLRIAGGWVRDKLLGLESQDMDIVLDTMTGYDFASLLKEHMHISEAKEAKVAKIDSNPEKSKHLETATMRIESVELDFVNLRSETYFEHSRVPQMAFGSPLEDAQRRDLTINALFYNLHTEQVEDFTGFGLKDLQEKLARTPLDPLQTFIDDPLRVLRVIRFAARLDYNVHESITLTLQNKKEIHDAFGCKISRERVGTEVYKMLSGQNPLRSLKLINEFRFFDVVFTPPAGFSVTQEDDALQIASRLDELLVRGGRVLDETSVVLYLCVVTAEFRNSTFLDQKSKTVHVCRYIVSHSLKMSTSIADRVTIISSHADRIKALVDSKFTRKDAGLLVRSIGQDWENAVLFANSLFLSHHDKFANFADYVYKESLDKIHEMRPLLSGKQVADVLKIKPGPFFSKINQEMIEFQLENPNCTVTQVETWLEKFKTDQTV